MTLNLILVLVLAVLQVLDGITTVINLKRPGGKEHNDIILKMMSELGMVPALVVKGLAVCALAYGIYRLTPYLPPYFATVVLGGCAAFYAYIVTKNASHFW